MTVFKGKLRAYALRNKFTDAADLQWLESRFSARLVQQTVQLEPVLVGLAIRRYPELTNMFNRLSVNLKTVEAAA